MKCNNKFNLLNVSKFFLVFLILSININGANFFRTKEIFFFLFVLTGFTFGNYKNIKPFVLMFCLYFSSLIFNLIVPGSNVDVFYGLYFYLGFLYLFLLVFNNEYYRNITIDSYLFSAKIVALFVISIWVVCFIWNDIKWQLITYFSHTEKNNVAFIFMIRSRKILNWWIPGVYYSTAPCMIPALAYYFAKAIRNNGNINKISCIFLSLGLILTAARANILAAFTLIFMYIVMINYLRKRIIISTLLAMLSLFGVVIIMYLLLNAKENSLALKMLHEESYLHVFDLDPFRTMVFGWGAGSSFFTRGFNSFTMLTELTLYETVRRYGVVSTILIISFIWLPPIYKSFFGNFNTLYLGLGLFIYILVASTNPFLLGSIGFCSLFFFSSAISISLCKKI